MFLLVRYASLLKKIEAYDEVISLISKVIGARVNPDEEAHKMLGDIYVIKETGRRHGNRTKLP